MTLNAEPREHRENGRRVPAVANGVAAVDPARSPTAVLDSLCRSVTALAKATPVPPRRIKVQHGQATVELEWPDHAHPPGDADDTGHEAVHGPPPGAGTALATEARDAEGERRQNPAAPAYVCSPSVGTFYRAPEPGAPPFVSAGDVVKAGQPIGILEVMKMMSPIEADVTGRVVEILVRDGHPVEFQQRLIAVQPLDGDAPAPGTGG